MLKSALKVLKEIENNGFEAYIVGGYPRDYYLEKESLDIDICTSATPKDLISIFPNANLSNEKYGGVSLYFNNIRFEITTYRKEFKYINNRLPSEIKYIDSLEEDLKRRDFTINTMCINSSGTIIDLMGAKDDIKAKVIKMVGDPKKSLKEDALRILRAVRFATILNFKIDSNLKKYIKKYAYLLQNLSFYRKKSELDKIFSSYNSEYGINLIKELKLYKYLGLKNFKKLKSINSLIGIWAQLEVDEKYPFTKNEKEMLRKIKSLLSKNILNYSCLYNNDLYIISIVGEIRGISKDKILEMYNSLTIKERKDINITSKEICRTLKIEPSCLLKSIWNDLEIEILNGNVLNSKEDIIKYLKNLDIQNKENKV